MEFGRPAWMSPSRWEDGGAGAVGGGAQAAAGHRAVWWRRRRGGSGGSGLCWLAATPPRRPLRSLLTAKVTQAGREIVGEELVQAAASASREDLLELGCATTVLKVKASGLEKNIDTANQLQKLVTSQVMLIIRPPVLTCTVQLKHKLIESAIGDSHKELMVVDIEEFKKALGHVDSQVKSVPVTAQVAAQQGYCLTGCFNKMYYCKEHPEGPLRMTGSGAGHHNFHPFRIHASRAIAPLGGEQAAAELPGDWVSLGHSTQWLLYSVYASKPVSWRTRMLVVSDLTHRFIFGRDSSKI